ncbi:UNVERIFIED_CONTAM: hypothetical protein FKN15_070135 [Acipenser sinensis]
MDLTTVRCGGHSLQLSARKGLAVPEIDCAIGASRKLIGHFRMSSTAQTKLHLRQEQFGVCKEVLTQDVPMRWNATYSMIERLSKHRWPLSAVLSDRKVTKQAHCYLDLKPEQCDTVERRISDRHITALIN